MKIYGARRKEVDIESLKHSVFYTFDQVRSNCNLSPQDLRIIKIKLQRNDRSGSIRYRCIVYFKLFNLNDGISLSNVPTNCQIKEDYWKKYIDYISTKVNKLRSVNIEEARAKFEAGFEQFKDIVNENCGAIKYRCEMGSNLNNSINSSSIYTHNGSLDYCAYIEDTNMPGFSITPLNDYPDEYELKSNRTGYSLNIYWLWPIRRYIYISEHLEGSIQYELSDTIEELNHNSTRVKEAASKLRQVELYNYKCDKLKELVESKLPGVTLELQNPEDYSKIPEANFNIIVDGYIINSKVADTEDIIILDDNDNNNLLKKIKEAVNRARKKSNKVKVTPETPDNIGYTGGILYESGEDAGEAYLDDEDI